MSIAAAFSVCGRFCGRCRAFFPSFPFSQNRRIIFCTLLYLTFVEKLGSFHETAKVVNSFRVSTAGITR
jgi:hypothetical protein